MADDERTPGSIFRRWLADAGRSVGWVAKEVGTSRQNLENFRDGKAGQPRYLDKLAHVMGYTLDELLQLQDPPPLDQAQKGQVYVMRLTEVERAMVLAGRAAASGESARTGPPGEGNHKPLGQMMDIPRGSSGGMRRMSSLRGGVSPQSTPKAKPKKGSA